MSKHPWWFDEERLSLEQFEGDKVDDKPKSKSEMKRLNALQGRDIAEGLSEQSKPKKYDLVGEYDFGIGEVNDGDYVRIEDYDALSAKCAELEKENEHLKSQVFSLELGRREMFAAESLKQNHELESLRAELSEKERELVEVKGRLSSLCSAALESSDVLKKCHAELLLERSKIAELEKQLAEKEAEIADLKQMHEEYKGLHDNFKAQRQQIRALREDWVEMKAALEKCRQASKVNEAKIDKMEIRNITGMALASLKYKGE